MTTRRAALAGLLLALSPGAFALNPALDISQYAHTSWKYRDGFTKGIIYDLAQTPDGFLWLATDFGLVRFDGVKPVPWEPPADPSHKAQSLPSTNVRKLFVDHDGTLWISTLNGLASWKNGKLTQYPELSGFAIGRAIQDHAGSIWAAARSSTIGKLCEIRNNIGKCYGQSVLGNDPFALHEDRKGYLWVGVAKGVWRWKPGPPEFYLLSKQRASIQITEDQDGGLLVTSEDGLRRLIDGKVEMAYPLPAGLRELVTRMLQDRDGGVWAGTLGGGIVHFHQGRTDVFSQADGLTGDNVLSFFEDREANIWVATANGLDRFRELPVVTYTTHQGLSSAPTAAVLAARDGSIWFDTASGSVNRLDPAGVTAYSSHGASPAHARVIHISGLPDHQSSLFEDSRGRIWISSLSGVGYLENDRYIPTTAPGGYIKVFTEDSNGELWIANQDLGLIRLSPDNKVQQIPWDTFGRHGAAAAEARNPQGGIWIGFDNGGLAWFRDGRVQASYSATDGLGQGRVNDLRLNDKGVLWAATDGGLSLFQNGRFSTITKESGLPCDGVHWSMPDDFESLWMMTPCGLVRAKLSEVESWSPGRSIHTTLFGGSDGVSLRATAGGINPPVAKSPDGRLWFWNNDGIGVVDPRHLPFNKVPPPVYIEQIIADRKAVTARSLPALTRDLEIDYTALSLVAPEKNGFKYKLEGHDRDWIDAGNRRQAFYTDLPPRSYRFRVQASNNDGVWNEAGAAFDFSIAPAFYQTGWFRASDVGALLLLIWALYRYRLYQIAREYNLRLDERLEERTRIARELHDTLLQSFQGLMLRFQSVLNMLPTRPSEAMQALEVALDRADHAIIESREAIQNMRSSTTLTNDLAESVRAVGKELAPGHAAEFRVLVEGSPRDLHPLVRDEVYRIAREAIRNAFLHAQAEVIEAEITYGDSLLRLRVRDDGKGIDPAIAKEGRSGHYGLAGMRERAAAINGQLNIWSGDGAGTEIELNVPASMAYATPGARPRRGKTTPVA